MAKATTTIRQMLNHCPDVQAYFTANQALFNRVASFYFDVIQAHVKVLDLSNKEALTALEKLTHTTELNPHPVMPRTWNKSATLYAGMWKDRTDSSISIKVWTGASWSWIRVRITGCEIPEGFQLCSPQLVRKGKLWYLHTPLEKKISNPVKIEKQIKTNK